MNTPIGILGGTFSPIHYGHLRPAEQIRVALGLDHIRVMPCHKPPHREDPGVSADMRLAMAELACREFPHFRIDERELKRHTPSYTAVTLEQMCQEFQNTPLCLLIGMDSLLSFKQWYQWQSILERCHLVVSCRPGWQLDASASIFDVVQQRQTTDIEVLHQTLAGVIYFATIDEQNISSTQIRQRLLNGQSTEGMLSEPVAQYIKDHRLYQAG